MYLADLWGKIVPNRERELYPTICYSNDLNSQQTQEGLAGAHLPDTPLCLQRELFTICHVASMFGCFSPPRQRGGHGCAKDEADTYARCHANDGAAHHTTLTKVLNRISTGVFLPLIVRLI